MWGANNGFEYATDPFFRDSVENRESFSANPVVLRIRRNNRIEEPKKTELVSLFQILILKERKQQCIFSSFAETTSKRRKSAGFSEDYPKNETRNHLIFIVFTIFFLTTSGCRATLMP